jgi:peptide/nickel transport system permease protein
MPRSAAPRQSFGALMFARTMRDPRSRTALVVLVLAVLAAFLAPLLTPYDPAAQLDIVRLRSLSPSPAHPFGTDPYSRDVLTRVLFGARVSLSLAFAAVALSVSFGILVGVVAGYLGGVADTVLMRLVDTALAIPRLLLIIAVVALWGSVSVLTLTLLIAGVSWFAVSRLVRAEALAVRDREYVVAARALGVRPWRIMLRHVLPNVVGPGLVNATLAVGNVILLEAGLSFLGIGVRPPTASWGSIIQDGAERVSDLWWLTVFPGLAIVITVFACNALGDALRDALDPRQLPLSASEDIVHRP